MTRGGVFRRRRVRARGRGFGELARPYPSLDGIGKTGVVRVRGAARSRRVGAGFARWVARQA